MGPITDATWPLALAAAAVAGIVLAWLGRRGWRVDDHPLCRRCGFDLTGRPDTSTRCAECGADLSARRAIRIGNRVRRPGWQAVGLALFLTGLVPLATFGLAYVRSLDPESLKPLFWVTADALGDDPGARKVAFAELQRRVATGRLSRGAIAAFVVDILAWQADVARPWSTNAGNFLEDARDADVPTGAQRLVSDEQWVRYARQALRVSVRARSHVTAGDPLPLIVTRHLPRAGSRSRFMGFVMRPTVSDEPLTGHGQVGGMRVSLSAAWVFRQSYVVPPHLLATTAPTAERPVRRVSVSVRRSRPPGRVPRAR